MGGKKQRRENKLIKNERKKRGKKQINKLKEKRNASIRQTIKQEGRNNIMMTPKIGKKQLLKGECLTIEDAAEARKLWTNVARLREGLRWGCSQGCVDGCVYFLPKGRTWT